MCWLSAQPRPLSSLLSLFFLNLAEDLLGGGRHIHRNLGGHILEALLQLVLGLEHRAVRCRRLFPSSLLARLFPQFV